MPAYLVTLDRTKCGHQLMHGADAMAVFAASETIAKQMAAAKYPMDGAAWINDGTATEIVAGTNWLGWTFKVRVLGGLAEGAGVEADGAAEVSLTATGAAQDTMDEIGALLATALNALPTIANAAYNSTTNTLTVAGAADGLGDQQIEVDIIPPGGESSIAGLVGTIVDGGASGDALTVVLPADAAVIPSVASVLKQV